VFLINRGEIEGRLNPFFYAPHFYSKVKEIMAGKNKVIKLKFLASKITDGTHFTPQYKESGVKFLSVKDVREHEINFSKTKFISQEEHQQLNKRCNPESGDILLTKVGTIGLAAVIPNNAPNFSIFVSVALIKLKNRNINPHYLAVFLNTQLARFQEQRILKGVGVPDFHLEDIGNLLIPLPDLNRQQQIADFLLNAHESKKSKEAEAAALLASIDDYLLQELGITLPPASEKKTFFITQFNQVSGGRFDSSFYKPEFTQNIEKIKSSVFNIYHLRDLITFSTESWNGKDFFTDEFPYIEISEIDISFGEIRNTNYISIQEAPSRAKMVIRNDDLIVSTTRPSRGAIAYINQEEDEVRVASTGFAVLRKPKMEIDKYFLLFILKHKMTLMQMEQRSSGGNYPAITLDELANILIPLPPIEKQTEIANHISAIRFSAKQLQQQAAASLEQAKQQVAKLILGE